jgi:hypothetical protein
MARGGFGGPRGGFAGRGGYGFAGAGYGGPPAMGAPGTQLYIGNVSKVVLSSMCTPLTLGI